MSTDHGEHHRHKPAKRPLLLASGIILTYFVVEVIGAIASGSLALLADAAHTISDTAALGLAIGAAWLAGRPGTSKRTYGYLRAEVLAALANGALLLVIATVLFLEAARRIGSPPEVQGGILSIVAAGGIAANVLAALVLIRGSRHNINIRGALFHVAGDAVGSAGAVVAGLLITFFGWRLADPIATILIGVLLLFGALRLLREASHILLEGSPGHVDTPELMGDIRALPCVLDVHDIHTWTITSGYHAMSAHVTMGENVNREAEARLLEQLRDLVGTKYGITHVTVQLERGEPACVEEDHIPSVNASGRTSDRGSP